MTQDTTKQINPADTVEYWKSRAETAELKVLTFHEEIAELGDGEPSPPNCQKCGKPKLGPMSTVASGYLRETEGMWSFALTIRRIARSAVSG